RARRGALARRGARARRTARGRLGRHRRAHADRPGRGAARDVNYVLQILLALATQWLLPELGWTGGAELAALVPLLSIVPYRIALGARRAALGGRLRTSLLLERLLAAAPVLLQALAIALGWLEGLERFGIPRPRPDETRLELLAAVAPYVFFQLAAI